MSVTEQEAMKSKQCMRNEQHLSRGAFSLTLDNSPGCSSRVAYETKLAYERERSSTKDRTGCNAQPSASDDRRLPW